MVTCRVLAELWCRFTEKADLGGQQQKSKEAEQESVMPAENNCGGSRPEQRHQGDARFWEILGQQPSQGYAVETPRRPCIRNMDTTSGLRTTKSKNTSLNKNRSKPERFKRNF
jgi:hypothetical protein